MAEKIKPKIPVNTPQCKHGKHFLDYCPECEATLRWLREVGDVTPGAEPPESNAKG